MFGISDENIIEQGDEARALGAEPEDAVRIRRNQTTPDLIEDGVDSLIVTEESADCFRVEYSGYMRGFLLTTHEGITELGESFFADQREIPHHILSTGARDPPRWVPPEYSPPSPVNCGECGDEVAVTNILTPIWDYESDRFCPECWKEVREG